MIKPPSFFYCLRLGRDCNSSTRLLVHEYCKPALATKHLAIAFRSVGGLPMTCRVVAYLVFNLYKLKYLTSRFSHSAEGKVQDSSKQGNNCHCIRPINYDTFSLSFIVCSPIYFCPQTNNNRKDYEALLFLHIINMQASQLRLAVRCGLLQESLLYDFFTVFLFNDFIAQFL